ncbi:MAG: YhdP family protein, partial [Lysobacteraceae bacterium]
MTSLRRRLRLARRGLWYVTAVSIVLMALGAAILSQLLPLAERHPDRIAEWLSARAGRTVRFDRLDTAWTRRGPLLRLDGLRVGDGPGAVSIGAAEILVSQYAGLLPGRSFTELRVHHLALTLERADDGRWQVRGLPGQAQGGDPLSALEGLGELQVIDAKLGISAPSLGIETAVPHVDLRLQVQGKHLRSGLRARMRADAVPIDFALDFDRARGDGQLYAVARDGNLADWSPLLKVGGVTVTGGRGRAELWATLRHRQVAAIAVDGDLRRLRLRGATFADALPDAAVAQPVVEFSRLKTVARWHIRDGGWRLDAPTLRVEADADSRPQVLDGLAIASGRDYGLRADRIDAGPLFAVFALSDRMSPKLRRWLVAARPGAVLEQVRVAGTRGGTMRAAAQVRALGFAPVGNTPGIADLAGTLHGDGDGFAFTFDPAKKLRFDWPTGFGATHVVGLRGEVVAWRDEDRGWRVETAALRLDGDGYGVDARGGVWFQGDGTRPRLDLVADLDDANAPVAKRFWPKFAMSPSLVHWLDEALVAGRVRDGRAVVAGELDDWPFKSIDGAPPKGIFDARATLQDMHVKFASDWPTTADMDADIAFVDNGFRVAGKAMLGEVGIRAFSAGIPDYAGGLLDIRASSETDAGRLLALLRESPLRREHGKVLSTLSAAGPAVADFDFELPLHGPQPHKPKIDGTVELRGARLAESEWKLAFAGVTGKARYDEAGFTADGLRAQYDRQDGKLSLRAGPGHVRDRRQGFEAELEASMTSDDLLARVPDLAWLRPHVRGRSRWTAGIAIPAAAPGTVPSAAPQITRLQLRSDLVGTAFDLPAPMDKPAGTALPTTLDLPLPIGRGELALAFGQRLALRVRQGPGQGPGQLGIRAMFGSDRVAEAPPASGLVLGGRAPVLDAIGWIALTEGDGAGGGRLALRRADVMADRLQLLGGDFPDTRLQIVPVAGGLSAQVDGAALAGTVAIPDSGAGTISGRLQRAHWRASPGGAAATVPATAPVADGGFDPAKIPAIALRVDDLRIGGAA